MLIPLPDGVTESDVDQAVHRSGVPADEARLYLADGLAYCAWHRRWHARSAFGPDAAGPLGLKASCKVARQQAASERALKRRTMVRWG